MALYRTKGIARRRIRTLARLAGIPEPLVGFSRAELERLSPGCLDRTRKSTCTVRDTTLGCAWQDRNLIWLRLPVDDDTLAHEVNHLRTRTAHTSQQFHNQVVALSRGLDPRQAKPQWYEVTIVTTEVRKVYELSPSAAKQRAHSGSLLKPVERRLTARHSRARALQERED